MCDTLYDMTTYRWNTPTEQYLHTFTVDEMKALLATVDETVNFRVKSKKWKVDMLATNMLNGTYVWRDADPIRLDTFTSGPSNGLHRLRAAVQAGVPLTANVWVGSAWRAGHHTDSGSVRNVSEYLSSRGIKSAGKKAAAAAWTISRDVGRQHEGMTRQFAQHRHVTMDMVIDFVVEHDDLIQEFMYPYVPATFGLSPKVWIGSMVELELNGWSRAANLLHMAPAEYETMMPNDPIQKLLTACMRSTMGQTGKSVHADVLSAGIRKALGMWVGGEYPDIWRWPRDASERTCDWLLAPPAASAIAAA